MSNGVIYQTRGKRIARLNLTIHIMWTERRDHLVGDMTPLADTPSSLVVESRDNCNGPLTWSIPRHPLRSHSMVCSKNHLFIVGIGPICDKELEFIF